MNKTTSYYINKIELIIYLKRNELPQIYYVKNMGGYIALSSVLKLVAVEFRMPLLPEMVGLAQVTRTTCSLNARNSTLVVLGNLCVTS